MKRTRKRKSKSRHDFLRAVVRLCLAMMVILTLSALAASFVAGVPIDAGSLGILMGGWCGELLLTLLKRKWEMDDKEEMGVDETTIVSNEIGGDKENENP